MTLSEKKVTSVSYNCFSCDDIYGIYFYAFERRQLHKMYDGNNYCHSCWMKQIRGTKEQKIKSSLAAKKFYKENPHILEQKKQSMLGKNSGESNGMKRKEVREQVSKTRKKLYKLGHLNKITSDGVKQAWKEGKFEHVNVGKCKWYDYIHSNGKKYKVQGTWELEFIKWLDKQNIKFKCHKEYIPYILNNEKRLYYPDFYIYDWECYVDVKAKVWYNEEKINAILESNKDMKLKILFKKDLQKLGVNIK